MNRELHWLFDTLETPLGPLAVVADEEGALRAVGWTDGHARMESPSRLNGGAQPVTLTRASNPHGLTSALRGYFAGDLHAVDRLRVGSSGGTAFQRAVWAALREIGSGETRSYGDVARRIGRPRAVRAVGLANRANPIAIVVPCHRVIGADGSLTGYGAGIDRKRWLLAHEQACAQRGGERTVLHD